MITTKCQRCQSDFQPTKPDQRYCNHRCRKRQAAADWRARGKQARQCPSCSNPLRGCEKACKNCLTLHDVRSRLSVKGKHPSWFNSHVRLYNRSWNKELLSLPCQVCGYKKHIELAHIKAVSTFPVETAIATVNNPDNILVLCPNHHWEFDNELIDLVDILPRPEQAMPIKLRTIYLADIDGHSNRQPKPQNRCKSCSKPICKNSEQCTSCKPTKIQWPSNEELAKLVWDVPCSILASQLGVSDKAIEKRCKKYSIAKPERGYWAKLAASKQKDA